MRLVPVRLDACPDCEGELVASAHVQAPLFWWRGEGGPVKTTLLFCKCGWGLTVSVETVRPTDDEVAQARSAM